MNYKRIYDSLVERAVDRVKTPDCYLEKHHVLPRCMGGTNDPNNIALLTAEEHYLAHQLLVKIYPEKKGLVFAALMMTRAPNGVRANNKLYGWIRRRIAETMSNRIVSDETRQKISTAQKGVSRNNLGWNDEAKARRKLTSIGSGNNRYKVKHSEETKKQISASLSGINHPAFGTHRTLEERSAISKKLKGRKLTPESIIKRTATRAANRTQKEKV